MEESPSRATRWGRLAERGVPHLLAIGTLGLLGVGCQEGGGVVGLGDAFDPAATAALVESLSEADRENVSGVHVSLAGGVLAEAVGPASASATSASGLLERVVRGSAVEGRAEAPTFATAVRAPALSLLAPRASVSGAGRASLMPDTLMGRTFGLEGGIGGYRVIADATDAPGDGVRFRTYELDPVTGRPRRVPLNREGHLDVRETAPGTLPRLELNGVAKDGRTELDLYLEGGVSASESELVSDFVSAGSILADDDPVEFSLDERVAFTDGFSRLEITFSRRIEMPGKGRSVGLEWQGVAAADGGEVTSDVSFALTVVDGGHSARVDLVATAASVNGTVTYDGVPAAVVSGDPLDPTISRPDGSPFSADETDAVLRLIEGPDVVLEFGGEMLSALAVLFES